MSVAGPIRNLLQQQDKALYQVKQKIKEHLIDHEPDSLL